MRYSESPELEAAYALIARLSQADDPGDARFDEAMTIAAALASVGEDRSWASVWWAYGALHYDLGDEALESALELLGRVEQPEGACAAAFMLRAEIEYSKAVYAESEPAPARQRALLERAVLLAPDWPGLHLRLARASQAARDTAAANEHAIQAVALLAADPTTDPFDSAITGRNLDRAYVRRELRALGLADAVE